MDHLRQRVLAVSLCAAILAPARAASAQPDTFVQALSELSDGITGSYGDEGPRVELSLDKMAAALAQWDRDIQAFESRVVSDLRHASPAEAVRLRTELARRYAERGRRADALRELEAALTIDPHAPTVQLFRGQLLESLARPSEAAEAFRRAWVDARRDPVAAYYFRRYAATNDPRDVRGAHDTLMAAYQTRLAAGERGQAPPFTVIDLVQDTSEQTPAVAPVIYRQGYAHLARGEYAEAITGFRSAAAIDPLIVDPLSRSASLTRAVAALRQGRTAEARKLLEGADGGEESSAAHRVLGLIDWADSEYDRSIAHLAAAIRLQPRDERSRVTLARVLSSAGRQAEAEQALRETLEVLPDSALAAAWLGAADEQLNRFAEARQALESGLAGMPLGRGAFYASIGRLAAGAGDFAAAIEAWTNAIAARPNDAELHKRLAHALLQHDRTDEALDELVAAVLIDPLDAGAHLGIGRILLTAGRNEDAVAALRRAVQLLPGHTEARYALATALTRVGHNREAAQEFDRVAEAQRRELADRRQAFALATIKEEAALRSAEGSHDRAVSLWRQAIQREPGQSSNHLHLAAALSKAGHLELAIEQYEIALRLGAEPLAYRQLADLYARLGRETDASRARASYTRALQGAAAGPGTAP